MATARVVSLRRAWLVVACVAAAQGTSATAEAQSQPSPRLIRYNGGASDRAGGLAVEVDGTHYVAGAVEAGASQPSFAVTKFDRDGNLVWRTNYNGSAGGTLGQAAGVAVDAQGNVYAVGTVSVGFLSTQNDGMVVKFNANGVQQWARRYNGPGGGHDAFGSVVVDDLGNAYIGGSSYGTGTDWVTQKYSPDGTLVWTRRVSGPGQFDDVMSDLALDAQGHLLATGVTKNRGDSVTNDITTVKYTRDGAVVWSVTHTQTAVSDDLVFDMAVDGTGAVYLSGAAAPTADPEGPLHTPLTLRYDANGQLLSAVQETAAGNGLAVALDPAGDVYVATESTLFKYDRTLAAIRAVPLAGNLFVASMAADSQSNVFVAATVFDPFTFVRDFHTTKLDAAGRVVWTHRFNGTGNRDDVVAGGALDGGDNFLVAGTSWGNYVSSGGTSDDIVTLTFRASDSGTPVPQVPAAPANLTATALSRNQIRLSWSDRSNNETGFAIDRCTGAGCTNFANVAQVPAGTTTFVNTGLSRRTTYRYRVRAVNAAGSSSDSNIASATTPK
jgi:hypothetical protein